MSYGVKYRADYDTITGVTYRVEILLKDYSGDIYPMELSGEPVVQNYQTDEPIAPIKGCSLKLTLHNTGSLPITTFYSVNDDEWKIIHYKDNAVTFAGFLVQDDCRELMVDYRHEITLSANDNLGLLKDVVYGQVVPAGLDYTCTLASEFSLLLGYSYLLLKATGYVPSLGTPITFSGHPDSSLNATFIPLEIVLYTDSGVQGYQIRVADTLTDIVYSSGVTLTADIKYFGLVPISEIVRLCLYATSLELDIYVYCNLFEENNVTTESFFEQNQLDIRTFYQDKNFKTCSEILEIILTRFNATLFQANGHWNIIRFDELRYGDVNGFIYDSKWNLQGTTTINSYETFGYNQIIYPENAPERSITRPFKYDKETFNYVQPKYLIINADLQNLGTFDTTSTVDGFKYDYYLFPEESQWLHMFPSTSQIDVSRICVKTDIATNREVERYVFQPKTNTGGPDYYYRAGVQFNDIQISEGDVMEFTLQIKSASSTSGDAVVYRVGFYLLQDEGSYYQLANGLGPLQWNRIFSPVSGVSSALVETSVLAADAENYYDYVLSTHSNISKVPAFPVDGVLRIRVYGTNDTSGSQPNVNAIWKDITLTITQNINDSTNIIGQVHTDEQTETIKNNNSETIYIDDSPRSTIAGTIFRNDTSNLVLLRTENWYRTTNNTERLRIGNITTLEELFLRRRPRTKIEGNFIGIDTISMLSKIKYSPFTSFNFVFGMLEISYKNNSFRCTLFEMFEDGEVDADLTADYTFTYLYNTQ